MHFPTTEEIIGFSGIIFILQAITLSLIQKELLQILKLQRDIVQIIKNRENLDGVLTEIKDLHDRHKK